MVSSTAPRTVGGPPNSRHRLPHRPARQLRASSTPSSASTVAFPDGGLLEASDGALYGVAKGGFGGFGGGGVVYRLASAAAPASVTADRRPPPGVPPAARSSPSRESTFTASRSSRSAASPRRPPRSAGPAARSSPSRRRWLPARSTTSRSEATPDTAAEPDAFRRLVRRLLRRAAGRHLPRVRRDDLPQRDHRRLRRRQLLPRRRRAPRPDGGLPAQGGARRRLRRRPPAPASLRGRGLPGPFADWIEELVDGGRHGRLRRRQLTAR